MLISAKTLSVSFGDKPVVEAVDLDVEPGKLVVLIGPNGSGKTTLIRALAGFVKVTGAITWNDIPLDSITPAERSQLFAYLPQQPTWSADASVLETLLLARVARADWFGVETKQDLEVAGRVAESLELTSLLHRRLGTLSGGQRQRVMIGRCLAQEPKALLLDEPTTYLDLRHQHDLHELLTKLSREQGLAVVLAGHDVNLAMRHADQVVLLNQGRIVRQGEPRDVLRPDILESVYDIPMKLIESDGRLHLITL